MKHGDQTMVWIALAGAVAFCAVVAVFAVGTVVDRRTERLREADDAATRSAAMVAGPSEAELADAERDARIAAWEHDPDYFRRRDLATMDQYTKSLDGTCERLLSGLLTTYEDVSLAIEGFGFPIQRARARIAELYDRAHNFDELHQLARRPLTTKVDATDTHQWTQAEVDELNDMLAFGEIELAVERAEATA